MSWFNYRLALNLCKNDIFFNGKQIQCVAFLDFFAKAQDARELIKNHELNLYVSRDRLSQAYQNYHISVSIRKSAKCGHCTRAEQEC